jgi:hypothetical protein
MAPIFSQGGKDYLLPFLCPFSFSSGKIDYVKNFDPCRNVEQVHYWQGL